MHIILCTNHKMFFSRVQDSSGRRHNQDSIGNDLSDYELNMFHNDLQIHKRARIERLESRLIRAEDSNMAMGSRLDFIQADVSSTRSAMQELIAMIKRSTTASKEADTHVRERAQVHKISPEKSGN